MLWRKALSSGNNNVVSSHHNKMDSTVFYPSLFSTKYAKAKKVLEGGPMSPKARSALTELTSDEAAAKKKKRKSKKSKKRLPKNLNVEPDPERYAYFDCSNIISNVVGDKSGFFLDVCLEVIGG